MHDKIVKELGEDKPIVTLGNGPDFGVVRATDAVNEIFGFSVNTIVDDLKLEIPQAGIDGGGHECAGSIKYVEGFSDKVLDEFKNNVESLSRN